jgi:glycosyltransferase involved in cell wall biosynthesis
MPAPVVSVVTSVYNGGRYLVPSLASVLDQEGVEFEIVVVNDGSTDHTAAALDELARRHPRLRVLHQPNRGLTAALVRGCAQARGAYIARHDADDLSLPGRLARQAALLDARADLALVSGWTRAIGPQGELLFETRKAPDHREATRRLVEDGDGTYHGSVMFRADAYRRVGGYRPAFRFAQDWDLWLRLTEVGDIGYVPAFVYAFRFSDGSLSASRRGQQLRLLDVARRGRAARANGDPEEPLLEEAARISAEAATKGAVARGESSYFIGKCLLDRRDRRAVPYLARSVREWPWRWRPWSALVLASLCCRRPPPPEPQECLSR